MKRAVRRLLHGDRLGQVARAVDIMATQRRNVVCKNKTKKGARKRKHHPCSVNNSLVSSFFSFFLLTAQQLQRDDGQDGLQAVGRVRNLDRAQIHARRIRLVTLGNVLYESKPRQQWPKKKKKKKKKMKKKKKKKKKEKKKM